MSFTKKAQNNPAHNQPASNPMNVISDSCSVSTYQTQQSNSSQGSNTSTNPAMNGIQQPQQQQQPYVNPNTTTNNGNDNLNNQLPNKSPRLSALTHPSSKRRPNNSNMTTASAATTVTPLNGNMYHKPNHTHPATTPLQAPTPSQPTSQPQSNTQNHPHPTKDRRQKRLERNRESARLSRRRRKQYLEILEDRVNFLSHEMDASRRDHVLKSTQEVKKLRMELLADYEEKAKKRTEEETKHKEEKVKEEEHSKSTKLEDGDDSAMAMDSPPPPPTNYQQDISQKVHLLSHPLNRMSDELKVCITFGSEYTKSMVIPTTQKFILWLTLQNDVYYRGGRAASERLSAARIGERVSLF